jgi:hypothetical protein
VSIEFKDTMMSTNVISEQSKSFFFVIIFHVILYLKFLLFNNNFYNITLYQSLNLGTTFLVLILCVIQYSDAKSSYTNYNGFYHNNYNYCETDLCPAGKKHIGCYNKGKFGPKCTSDVKVVKIDEYTKRLILHLHNEYRNLIAEGRTVS